MSNLIRRYKLREFTELSKDDYEIIFMLENNILKFFKNHNNKLLSNFKFIDSYDIFLQITVISKKSKSISMNSMFLFLPVGHASFDIIKYFILKKMTLVYRYTVN